jgi:hypothetical protein
MKLRKLTHGCLTTVAWLKTGAVAGFCAYGTNIRDT